MTFSKKDLEVIENGLTTAYQIVKEHPNKNWKESSVRGVVKKLTEHGSADRRPGSGRPKTALTEENLNEVDNLMMSQEGQPGSHLSQRQIAGGLGISKGSTFNLVKEKGLKTT